MLWLSGGLASGLLAAGYVQAMLHRLAPQNSPAPGIALACYSLLRHSSASLPAAEAPQGGLADCISQAATWLCVPQLQVRICFP